MKENVPLDDPDVEANQEQTMWGEPQEGDAEMECDIGVDNFNSDTDDEDLSSQDEFTECEDEDFLPIEEELADDKELSSDDEELPSDNEEIPDGQQHSKKNLE